MIVPGTNGYDFNDSKSGYRTKNTPFGTNEEIVFEGLNQKYRVFIAGYDVTPDVSNLVITQKIDGEISCTFSLENTKNKYVITKEDLEINIPKIVRKGTKENSISNNIRETNSQNFNTNSSSDRVTLNSSINLRTGESDGIISSDGVGISINGRKVLNHEINDVYNKRSYYWKNPGDDRPVSLNPQLMFKHMLFVVKWLSNIEKGENECILDYKEPVVVFVQGRMSTMWYFGFTGGIRDYSVGFDYGGSQSISVNCVSRKYFLSRTTEVNSAVGKSFNLEAKNIDLRVNRSLNTALKDVFTTKYLKDLFTTMFLKVSKPKSTNGTFVDLPAVPINYIDSSWLLFMESYLSSTANMEKYASSEDPGAVPEKQSLKDTPEIVSVKNQIKDQQYVVDSALKSYEDAKSNEAMLKVLVDRNVQQSKSDPLLKSDTLQNQYGIAVKDTQDALNNYREQESKLFDLNKQLDELRSQLLKKSLQRSVAQYLSDAIFGLYESITNLFKNSSTNSSSERDGTNVDGWQFYNNVDTVRFYKSYLKSNIIKPENLDKNTKKTPSNSNSNSISQYRIIDWSNPLNTNYSSTVTDNIYQISVFTTKPYTTRNVSSILDSNNARVWETDFSFAQDGDYTKIEGVDTEGNETRYYQFNWKSKYSAGVVGIHPAVNEDFINKFHILPQIFGLTVDNDRSVDVSEKPQVIDTSPITRTVSQLSVAPADQGVTDSTQFFPPDYKVGTNVEGAIADKFEEIFSEINDRFEQADGKIKIKKITVISHEATQNDRFKSIQPNSVSKEYRNGKPTSVITILYDSSASNAARQLNFTRGLSNRVIEFFKTQPRFKSGKYKYESNIVSAFGSVSEAVGRGFFEPAGLESGINILNDYYAKDKKSIESGKVTSGRIQINAPLLRKYNVHPDFPDAGINFSELRKGSSEEKRARQLLVESRKLIRANRRVVITVEFEPVQETKSFGPDKVNKIRNAVRTPYEKLKEQVYGVPTDVDPSVDGINFHRPRFIVMLPPIYATDTTTTGLNFREFNIFNAQHINLKQVIDEFIKSIQFKYYETPAGDVVLEPINYDSSPWDQIASFGKRYGKYYINSEANIQPGSFVEQPSGSLVKEVNILPPYITTYLQPRNLDLIALPIVKPIENFRHPYYFDNMNEKNVNYKFKSDNIFTSITVNGLPPGTAGGSKTAALNNIFADETFQNVSKMQYANSTPLGTNAQGQTVESRPTATYVADGFEETIRGIDIDFKIASQSMKISAAVQGLVIDVYNNDSEALINKLSNDYGLSRKLLRSFQPTLDSFIKNIAWPILYTEIRNETLEKSKNSKPQDKKLFNSWIRDNGKSYNEITNAKIKKNAYNSILAKVGFSSDPSAFPTYRTKNSFEYIYDYPLFKKDQINSIDGVSISSEKRLPYIKGFTNITSKIFLDLKKPELKKGATQEEITKFNESLNKFNTEVKDNRIISLDDIMANKFIPQLMRVIYLTTPHGKKALDTLKNLYPKPKTTDKKNPSKNDGKNTSNSSKPKETSLDPKVTTFADFALARARGEYNPQADFVTLYGIKPKDPISVPFLRTNIDCKLYAIALFNQLYNNAFEYTYSSMPLTPEILVNRTGYFSIYNFIGLINGITHSISYGDNASTSLDISYPRRNIMQSNYSIIDYDLDKAPQSNFINADPYVAGSTSIFEDFKDYRSGTANYAISNFSIFRKLGALYEITQVGEGRITAGSILDYRSLTDAMQSINKKITDLTDNFTFYITKLSVSSINVSNRVRQYNGLLSELSRVIEERDQAAFEEKLYWDGQVKKLDKSFIEADKDLQIAIGELQYLTGLLFGYAFSEADSKSETVESKSGLNTFVKNILTAYPYLPKPRAAIDLMYKDYQKERIRVGGGEFKFKKVETFDYQDQILNRLCVKSTYDGSKIKNTQTIQPLLVCLSESYSIRDTIEENSKNFRNK